LKITLLNNQVLALREDEEQKSAGGIIIPDTAKEKPKRGKGNYGFDAETEKYENLIASGVIDPTKVVRFAVQDATSVSGLMITTEALVTEKPEKKIQTRSHAGNG